MEDMALTPALPGQAEGGHMNNQRGTPGHWSGKIQGRLGAHPE